MIGLRFISWRVKRWPQCPSRKRRPPRPNSKQSRPEQRPNDMSDVTRILQSMESGDAQAADELLPLVYGELRKLAASKMANESPNQTLQPTALVHEAWLRLTGNENVKWNGRAHFFGAAAEAMRRILIDNARRKQALRHGGDQQRLDVDDIEIAAPGKEEELLAINDALEEFAKIDPQKAELVKLRYFVGLKVEETAEVLGISVPTAIRWWNYSRAWLYQKIQGGKV
jgi:RNA polymerase sigma factor (TIGR02999 family)